MYGVQTHQRVQADCDLKAIEATEAVKSFAIAPTN